MNNAALLLDFSLTVPECTSEIAPFFEQGHSGTVIKTNFSHDGRYMCSLARDKTLMVWILKDCQVISAPTLLLFSFVSYSFPPLGS